MKSTTVPTASRHSSFATDMAVASSYRSGAKEELVAEKGMRATALTITKTDVIPLNNKAWPKSFARVRTNLKAMRARGWGPLNRMLLLHPEIIRTKTTDIASGNAPPNPSNATTAFPDSNLAAGATPFDVMQCNTTEGYAKTACDLLLQHAERQGSKERRLKNQADGQDDQAILERAKKVSAGNLFKNGEVRVGRNVQTMVRTGYNKRVAKEQEAEAKRIEKELALLAKVQAIRANKPDEKDWGTAEYRTMLVFKKIDGDPAVAGQLAGMKQQWEIRRNRPDPSPVSAPTRIVHR